MPRTEKCWGFIAASAESVGVAVLMVQRRGGKLDGSGRVANLAENLARSSAISTLFLARSSAASAEAYDAAMVGQMNAWGKDKQGPQLSLTATRRVLTPMLPMVS